MKSKAITFLWLLVCLLHCSTVSGQNQEKIDSLRLELKLASTDTIRIDILKNLSWYYATTRTKLDSAKYFADSLNTFSLKIKDEEGTALSYFYYGLIDRFSGNYYSGLKHFDTYLEYCKKQGDSLKMETGLFQKGVLHYNLGYYDKSLELYYAILEIYENNNMESSVATTLHSIGHIQRKVGQYEEAVESYEKSIQIKEEQGDKQGLAMSTTSLGNTYAEMEQNDLAQITLLKAYELTQNTKVPYLMALISENLGVFYAKTEEYSKALKYNLEALEIRAQLPSKKNLATNLNSVGVNYLKLGEFKKSRDNLIKSLNFSKEIGAKPITLNNYLAMAELYGKLGDFENANKFQNEAMDLKDSIFTSENNKKILELEKKYEVAQKDKDIQILTKENEIQEANSKQEGTLRKALVGGLLALGVISLLLFNTMRQRLKNQKLLTIKNEEINKAKLSEELQTLEMKALRAQMNPHFLFNSLNSINTMILNDEPDNASRYLSKFSKLVRLMLENSEHSKVSLKDELETLEAYIQLEAIRFNNKMEYKIDVDSEIDQEETLLPSMVLQPFVENAIWHGLLHKNQKGLLTIAIKEDEDNLLCSIIDNGVGRAKSLKLKKDGGLKKKSMGIKITTDRLKLLTKQKIKDVINIIDLKDNDNNALGTQVNIQIPLS